MENGPPGRAADLTSGAGAVNDGTSCWGLRATAVLPSPIPCRSAPQSPLALRRSLRRLRLRAERSLLAPSWRARRDSLPRPAASKADGCLAGGLRATAVLPSPIPCRSAPQSPLALRRSLRRLRLRAERSLL